MNIIPAAAAAWRDERSIEQAIRDHDKAGLAKGISLALAFVATLLGGTKYAPLVAAFADPAYVGAAGVLIAGVVAGFSHWSTKGALAQSAAVAGSTGDSPAVGPAPSAGSNGGIAAQPTTADQVRPVNSPSVSPGDYMQGGGG